MLADLVPRLVQKGYDVRCSCERPASGNFADDTGAVLDYFPLKPPASYTLRKAFELLYDLFFILKYAAICDVVYVLGIYGGASLLFPRLFGKYVVVNTDGLEWERAKYNTLERSIIVLYFALSLNLASKIIIDNKELIRFIGARHHSKTWYIPYGVTYQQPRVWDEAKLSHYVSRQLDDRAIEPAKYWLLVARLEPENSIDLIVKGFVEAHPENPLLIVGDFTSQRYRNEVYKEASNGSLAKILFLGAIYDAETLCMLRQHCLGYVHGHSVGGTNPSLLEAMASRNFIIAHDNAFNKDVCGPFARYFSNSVDVSNLVASAEQDHDDSSLLGWKAFERTAAYSWEHVAEQYHELLKSDSGAVSIRRETEVLAPHK